jgi:hypothetical protein
MYLRFEFFLEYIFVILVFSCSMWTAKPCNIFVSCVFFFFYLFFHFTIKTELHTKFRNEINTLPLFFFFGGCVCSCDSGMTTKHCAGDNSA